MKRLRAEFEGLHFTQRAHNIAAVLMVIFGGVTVLFVMNLARVLP